MLDASLEPETDVAASRRSGRFAARHTLWDESQLPRIRSCGRTRTSTEAPVVIRVSADELGRHAGYGNVQTCGSYWSCPVCSAKIAAGRQTEISAAVDAWVKRGGRVALGTFTMRHRSGQSLKSLWGGLSSAWHQLTSGSKWRADQLAFGCLELVERTNRKGLVEHIMVGKLRMIRVVEVTYGRHGWHVHVHVIFLLPASSTAREVAQLRRRMHDRWAAALQSAGFDCNARGSDLRLVAGADAVARLGDYFTKSTYSTGELAGLELARGDLKTAGGGNRTPFQVLADVVRLGDAEDLDVWHEWERGSKGKLGIVWSHGLRKELLGDAVEQTDEELAAAGDDGEIAVELDQDTHREVIRARADYRLLRAFEQSDQDGRQLLASFMIAAERSAPADFQATLDRRKPLGRARLRGLRR